MAFNDPMILNDSILSPESSTEPSTPCLDDVAGTMQFTIEETPRFGIGGSTDVVMAEGRRVTQLTWRPSAEEIISDVVLDYFVGHCVEEFGAATRVESEHELVWSWTTDQGVRAVVAARDEAGLMTSFYYVEMEVPALHSTEDLQTGSTSSATMR